MKAYQTDKNGFYVGEIEADKSPLEPDVFEVNEAGEIGALITPAKYLIPAGAVIEQPPVVGVKECAQLVNGAWVKSPDHRGTFYFTADHKKHEITERGVTKPAGTFDADPAKTQAEIDAETNAAAFLNLAKIDLASIRSMREYIASKNDAPQFLKDKEAAATAERAKVKA